jgi:hypothetical protein
MASRIAERRCREVTVTPATLLVTECPRCRITFDVAFNSINYSIDRLDLAELVARSLKEGD